MIIQPFLRFRPVLIATSLIAACIGAAFFHHAAAQELQFAQLGTCPLESGEVIEECLLGYRTVGELNPEGTNAVLLPTWGGGTSEQKLASEDYVGPEGWVDPDRHFVIVVDAFGNGVSSSPSNSRTQSGEAFPQFTIRDMVRAQHRLLTEEFELDGLHGVAGISMGGLPAFEWATTYPDFVARAVPVVATPRLSAHDLLINELYKHLLLGAVVKGCGSECEDLARETTQIFFTVMTHTPEHWERTLSRDDVPGFLDQVRDQAQNLPDTYDALTQIRAAIMMDVSKPFGGSMERAANSVEAEMLIVVNDPDLLVSPGPSRRFADMSGARLHEMDSDCGHMAFQNVCAGEEITPVIREFLSGEWSQH